MQEDDSDFRSVPGYASQAMLIVWVVASGLLLSSGLQSPEQGPRTLAITLPAPGEVQELVLKDGTRAYGRVERIDGDRITFVTTAGATIDVTAQQVVSLRRADGRIVRGEFWPADPNATRLFFAPTGRALKKGEAYFGVYEILLPFVQVGLTDRISIGGGTPLVFGLGSDHPLWLTPKIQVFSGPATQASVGVLHFVNVGDGSLGIAYAVVTRGNADSAVSGGIGDAYERGYDEDPGDAALVMVGGEHRVRRGMKIVTENYVWEGGGFASAGVRWFGKRLSADLGLGVPLGVGDFVAFPLVNFVWIFSCR